MRTGNIFKMSPEMLAILSTTGPLSGASDMTESSSQAPPPPVTGPLKSHHNNHHQGPPAYDPFSGPASRANSDGEIGLGGRLFYKSNEMKSAAAGFVRRPTVDEDVVLEAVETPTVGGAIFDPNGTMGVDLNDPIAIPASAASLRGPGRDRPISTLGMEFSDTSRSISTRAKSRVGSEVEEMSDGTTVTRATASSTLAGERKRTISGYVAQSSSQPADVTAAPQRRSVRLFNQIRPTTSKLTSSGASMGFREGRDVKKARATGTKGRAGSNTSTVGRVVSGNRKPSEAMDVDAKELMTYAGNGTSSVAARSQATEALKQQEALQWLLTLFRYLGTGYYHLSHYRCSEALQTLGAIPSAQRETPWVLAQMGRAYYEQALYADAEKYFKKLRGMSHSRLEDMEIYSTVLWHLKNEVELSFLAHELVDVDRLSPQAWCAIGNTFSLQRDHDQALKCFKRATQVDPQFAYAFTLQGHEHVANEEYDKALTAYRNAVNVDNRHYNAWYGLGNVFEKMGQYDVAQSHFTIAIRINPTNPVLICCLGVVRIILHPSRNHASVDTLIQVLEKNKSPRAALVQYAEACNLAPRSALPRYKKARVLFELGELQLALVELKICKDIAPDEANVHFWLGKVYRNLRQRADAIKHFTIALNLDPKVWMTVNALHWGFLFLGRDNVADVLRGWVQAGQCIKAAIESLEDDDEDLD